MSAWINEFHYDNVGTDSGEFIEVAATAGTDLTGWNIVRYNGSGGAVYAGTITSPFAGGIIADETGTGFGFRSISFAVDGLQNGSPDGFALVDNLGHVVQFLSYEGTFTAVGGAANGMLSIDVGMTENTTTTPIGAALGLQGSGANYADFTWGVTTATVGAANTGQTFGGGPVAPSVSVSDATVTEGDAGTVSATFIVTRTGGSGAFTVDYATANGTASAGSDYVGATDTLTFGAGVNSHTVTVTVNGDTSIEDTEKFFLNLSNPTGGAAISDAQGEGTITTDDAAPPVAGAVWINEFHYDNSGTDSGEFIEVAGAAGTSLSGYSLILYNGNGGVTYNTLALTGTFTNQQNGFGVLSFAYPANGIQNGGTDAAPDTDAIALVGPGGVIEFISYEGHLTATNGAAAGLTSVDVGVFEGGTAANTSISRVGGGAEGSDFTWSLTGDSHGAVNTGEAFLAPSPRLHVSDPTVTEGDNGAQTLTFTVTRSGTADAFQVHYATADGTATSGSDYQAVSGDLSFSVGETSKTIQVIVHGDTNVEGAETVLLNLTAPTNGAVIVDGQGRGVIANDDIALVKVYDIQGAGHTSALVGQHVLTEGVVTAIDTTGSRGFWIQDETGDGDAATSDAVFVFTNADPSAMVHVGDKVHVEGDVNEFQGSDANNLTITEVGTSLAHVSVIGAGTIAPTMIGGPGGLHPPTEVIEDDGFTSFDPAHDAADFYESLEGMVVTVHNSQAVDSTVSGSTWIVADNGADATGMNGRGGISITAGDLNPEKIQVFADSGVSSLNPTYVAGDHPGDVTGVISYFGGQYELLPTAIESTATAGAAPREVTTLTGDTNHVTIGAYNVENLDPTDPQSKFDQLGYDIAHNQGSPDIIGIEEIQDADGPGNGPDLTGTATLTKLVNAIAAAGGPHYSFIEVAPTVNGSTGGEGGGNIRQAFLYNADRVDYVDGSVRQLDDDTPATYNNSRKPLVADFMFNGEKITAIDVHNYSRGGSDEPFGLNQPPINSGQQRRIDQITPVKEYAEGLVAADPHAHVAVMGDFNGFQFELAQTQLESGGALTNLTRLLPVNQQFSYAFEGNMQQIDHLFVSPGLQAGAEFDIVHLNSGQAVRPTDHDPIVSRLYVNATPHAVGDTATVSENASITINVLGNDTDRDAVDTRTLVSVSDTTLGGHVSIVNGKAVYVADADAFDLLKQPQSAVDTFSYVMRDTDGATSTGTVSVTVKGLSDAPARTGTANGDNMAGTTLDDTINGAGGNDTLTGVGGADTLSGGDGADKLEGGAGIDSLSGGTGADSLTGGAGNDTISGGGDADRFAFTGAFGKDVVSDFTAGDKIQLDHLQFANFASVSSHALQVGDDVVVTLDASTSFTLQHAHLANLSPGDFIFV